MPANPDFFSEFDGLRGFESRLRFLWFILRDGIEQYKRLTRYWNIWIADVLLDCPPQVVLAHYVGCSQPVISRELPVVWKIWHDGEDLYIQFQVQLEDNFQRKVLKHTLEGKEYEAIIDLMRLPAAQKGREEATAESTEKVEAALMRIFVVRHDFRCRLLREYVPRR